MSDGTSISAVSVAFPARHFGAADVAATIVMNLTMGLNVVALGGAMVIGGIVVIIGLASANVPKPVVEGVS